MAKHKLTIQDLKPDPANANKGTERGAAILRNSIATLGAGRSIVADRNGVVLAGNKTLEAAADLGIDIQEIHTDGNSLVVVVRDDLDLSSDDDRARKLAYTDNRASELGLMWDTEQLLQDAMAMDLSQLFSKAEVEAIRQRQYLDLLAEAQEDEEKPARPGADDVVDESGDKHFALAFPTTREQRDLIVHTLRRICAEQGYSTALDALLFVLKPYLGGADNEDADDEKEIG